MAKLLLGILLFAVAGCVTDDVMLRKALGPGSAVSAEDSPASRLYQIGCADVLELEVPGRAEWDGSHVVHANGCIDLKGAGGLRVEGLNVEELREEIVKLASLPSKWETERDGLASAESVAMEVGTRIEQFASQQIYLFGDNPGEQRVIPYEGPETVVDFLRRVGIAGNAVPEHVYVVRKPLVEGGQAQGIEVDLKAVLLDGDSRSNIAVQPYDRIYVEETEKSRVGKLWRRAWPRALRNWVSFSHWRDLWTGEKSAEQARVAAVESPGSRRLVETSTLSPGFRIPARRGNPGHPKAAFGRIVPAANDLAPE